MADDDDDDDKLSEELHNTVREDLRDRRVAVKNAEDAVKNAEDAVKSADDAVKNASAEAERALQSRDFELYQTWCSEREIANERLEKANERLEEAREYLDKAYERFEKAKEFEVKRQRMDAVEKVPRSHWFPTDFQPVITPAPPSPFFTALSGTTVTMEEWLEMAYNGNVLNLEMDDAQLVLEEDRKLAGFQYFDMQFPVLLHAREDLKQSVFVRPCYENLFNLILKNIEAFRPSVAVTGNPGVGKSQFYAYCVFRLSKDALINGRTLIINKGSHFYAFADGSFQKLTTDQVNSHVNKKDVVRLIDGRSNELLGWNGVTILFTSPGCPEYHAFLKSSGVEYVMPPWTLAELTIAASVVGVSVAEVQSRSLKFGGIARYVFASDPSSFESSITESIPNDKLLKLFGAVNISEKDYSHCLLLMYPRHTKGALYRGFFLDFSSDEIADQLYKSAVDDSYEKLTEFVVANKEDSNSGGFRRTLFEIFCHRIWSTGGPARFEGRLLSQTNQDEAVQNDGNQNEANKQGLKFVVDVPDSVETIRFVQLTDIPDFTEHMKLYCRPCGKTFPCIDAIYWDGEMCHMLQMTISDRHGILHAPLIKILNWCADRWPIAFVFVVPDDKVEGYERQGLLTSTGTVHKSPSPKARNLEQYVVGVKVIPSHT